MENKDHNFLADIIIPHHDRDDLLQNCLRSIPKDTFNVIVESKGTFAENCNRGAKKALTDKLIFLNDDVEVSEIILNNLCKKNLDVVGVAQKIPGEDGIIYGLGFSVKNNGTKTERFFAKKKSEALYPSGFFFKINKKSWDLLGGFNEDFKNGCEDSDLFLRAIEEKININFLDDVALHLHSQSRGRADNNNDNFKLFDCLWVGSRIKKIAGDDRFFLDKDNILWKNGNNELENDIDICFVSHSSCKNGAERSMLELVHDLNKSGIKSYVILPQNGSMEEELNKMAIPYLILPYRWWTLNGQESIDSAVEDICEVSFTLLKKIKEIDPKLIYTNTSVINVGAIVAKELGIPHIWHVREYGTDHGINFLLNEKDTAVYIKENSDVVIFNSKSTKNHYESFANFDNSEVVYNNVSVKKICEKVCVFKKKDGLKLAIIGSVYEGKGQKDAVLAIGKLKSRNIDAELVVVGGIGNEDYKKEIDELVANENLIGNINFTGYLDNVYSVIKSADVILVCSKSESFGRVAIEAMLSNKPVIGTNSGGTAELVINDKNGLLYEPGNCEELADKVEFLVNHPEKMKEFGENGHRFVKENFSQEKYSKKIENIIEDVLGRKKRFLVDDIFSNKKIELLSEYSTVKDDLRQKTEKIRLIETSKFWKARNKYIRFKSGVIFALFSPKRFIKKHTITKR